MQLSNRYPTNILTLTTVLIKGQSLITNLYLVLTNLIYLTICFNLLHSDNICTANKRRYKLQYTHQQAYLV